MAYLLAAYGVVFAALVGYALWLRARRSALASSDGPGAS
jgi:CcmD family protein